MCFPGLKRLKAHRTSQPLVAIKHQRAPTVFVKLQLPPFGIPMQILQFTNFYSPIPYGTTSQSDNALPLSGTLMLMYCPVRLQMIVFISPRFTLCLSPHFLFSFPSFSKLSPILISKSFNSVPFLGPAI